MLAECYSREEMTWDESHRPQNRDIGRIEGDLQGEVKERLGPRSARRIFGPDPRKCDLYPSIRSQLFLEVSTIADFAFVV